MLLLLLFLMSGIHVGLVVLMNSLGWNELLQTLVPMTYWGLVAMGLTFFTRKKMRDTYEEPLHRLAEGTRKVAEGDFSVYVPTVHTSSRLDYLDVMILDFNKMVEELGSVETLKTDFVSNVSHEMKTPIAVIKNYAELLQTDRGTEEERREYARKSGTSMSTPQISGAIALALQKAPYLTNVQIKMMLRDSVRDLGLPHNRQGWGEFDLDKFLANLYN